jgi:hypothetical protein
MVVDGWITPLKDSQDPVQALIDTGREIMITMPPEQMERGCPLNNLTQELSNSDERFREHLAEVFDVWRLGIAEAFERGQALGKVRCDIDPVASATFFVAAIEGLTGLAKASHDRELALSAGMVLLQFLESLKLPPIPRESEAPSRGRQRARGSLTPTHPHRREATMEPLRDLNCYETYQPVGIWIGNLTAPFARGGSQ